MKAETRSLLNELGEADWFGAVGQPLPDSIGNSILTVSTWKQATDLCTSLEWADYTLEQSNLLTVHLCKHARGRYQAWNDIASEVGLLAVPMLEKSAQQALPEPDQKEVMKSVTRNVVGACMELEYSDIRPPAFFNGLMPWFLAGRLPCGWGKLDAKGKIKLLEPVEECDYDPNEPDWLKLVLANQKRVYEPSIRMPSNGSLIIF